MRRYNISAYDKIFEYRSVLKNTWLYSISRGNQHENLKIATIIYFYGKKGLIAFTYDVQRDTLHLHTSHFFKRYNERNALNLVVPEDILRQYLSEEQLLEFRNSGTGIRSITVYAEKPVEEKKACCGPECCN